MEDQRVSVEQLKQVMAADFERLAEQVAQALNAAKDGHIIADTEELVRDANAVFREQMYTKAIGLLQSQQEAFSPRPEGLRNKGKQQTTHLTVNGRLSVRRTVYWSASSGTVVPTDQWLGLTEHRFSPGVREMCCREALHCSFEVASDNLQRTAQLSLAGRSQREVVENDGAGGADGPAKGIVAAGLYGSRVYRADADHGGRWSDGPDGDRSAKAKASGHGVGQADQTRAALDRCRGPAPAG